MRPTAMLDCAYSHDWSYDDYCFFAKRAGLAPVSLATFASWMDACMTEHAYG